MTNLCLNDILHTRLDHLSPAQYFLIELHHFMLDIRQQADHARRSPFPEGYHTGHLRYLVGRLHGLVYGFSSLLIYGTRDYDEVSEIYEGAMNEADFLTGPYLHLEQS